ncbi:MAG: CoA transferase, partial [Rubritepida sp.]|nr:CoA transferase [Rubritepida sp.]
YDAAIGDLAVAGAPGLLRFSVFGPGTGTGPGIGPGPDFSPDPNPGNGLGLGLGPVPNPGLSPSPGPGGVNDPPMSELGLLALSGLLGIMGEAGRPPARLAGHQPAYAAGLAGCTALLAALRAAKGADIPETIDISLFDVTCWLNWKVAAAMLVMGEVPTRGGGRSDWFTLPAADGHIALVYMEKDFPQLRDMLQLTDPRFETRAGRLTHRAAFEAAIRPWFAARSRAEITREAQSRRIPIGPVRSPAELLTDPQHVARGFIGPGGMPGMPLRVDGMRPHG